MLHRWLQFGICIQGRSYNLRMNTDKQLFSKNMKKKKQNEISVIVEIPSKCYGNIMKGVIILIGFGEKKLLGAVGTGIELEEWMRFW